LPAVGGLGSEASGPEEILCEISIRESEPRG